MSGPFSASIAEGEDWAEAAKDCLHGLDLIPGANIGFLYVTDRLADQLGSIVTLFRGVTGIDQWVGTVGLGVCGTGREIYDRPAVSALIGCLPADGFRLIPALTDGLAPLEAAAGTWLALRTPRLALVHGDPGQRGLPDLLDALAERTGAFLVGGLTATRGESGQVAGRVVEGGLSGVMFSESVSVITGLTQGCTPIGSARIVTAAEDNILMQIDNRPALDVFKEEIGPELAADLRRVDGRIFAALPIPGSDTGDYLVRNLIRIDPQRGWIAIGDEVEAGQTIQFCRRDRAGAQADLERMLAQMKRRLSGPPKAGIYVTCVARGPHLFGPDSEELSTIRSVLGDFPLTGFFAAGEFSRDRLYGHTGVLTLFS